MKVYSDKEAGFVFADNFAVSLLNSRFFKEHSCTLYNDVPLKCIGYNGLLMPRRKGIPQNAQGRDASFAIDFVVCKGSDILACIVFEHKKGEFSHIFTTYLPGLPHCGFSTELLSDSSTDWETKLDEYFSMLTEARDCPTHKGYVLNAQKLPCSITDLEDRGFLSGSGFTLALTVDSGIFLQLQDDGENSYYATAWSASDYYDSLVQKIGLNLQPDPEVLKAFQEMSSMPLEELFAGNPEALQKLAAGLTAAGNILYPMGSPELVTYQNTAAILEVMQGRTCYYDAYDIDFFERTQKNALWILADALCSCKSKLLEMPVKRLFELAAYKSGNYHPIWEYEYTFARRLNFKVYPEESITFGDVLRELISQKENDYVSLPSELYCLLVLPFRYAANENQPSAFFL